MPNRALGTYTTSIRCRPSRCHQHVGVERHRAHQQGYPQVDGNGQVLGQDYRPIPGLFAAGNTAGSRFGIQYTTIYCGASVSFAVTQGKFTGEYVASL